MKAALEGLIKLAKHVMENLIFSYWCGGDFSTCNSLGGNKKLKKILFMSALALLFSGAANASVWKIDATSTGTFASDFTVSFNDANNDGIVTIDDVISFSGITLSLYNSSYYDTLISIPDNPFQGTEFITGLTLESDDTTYPYTWGIEGDDLDFQGNPIGVQNPYYVSAQ